MPNCQYSKCGRVARLFYLLPKSKTKKWMCAEHYDRMAAYYKKHVGDEFWTFVKAVVDVNGW